ncbi:MAG: DUF1549 and DUF1553 domain-containing protein [Planctomycetota bacterium]|nr:DUF1549 and DUF1553 domain-containing protein [Planctomycetota bacterium]
MLHALSRPLSLAILAGLLLCGPAATAENDSVMRLVMEPSPLEITGGDRQQQVLVTAIMANGTERDVTHEATLEIQDETIASATGSVIRGVTDGITKLKIHYGGRKLAIPLSVRHFTTYPPLDFRIDILPLFSKLGCNSGGCHGKQTGQNGFRLSVFGFNPLADYEALVKEARGRRVFPAASDRSLLVAKASGLVAHGGGQRITPGSHDEEVLTQWIRQGMPWKIDNPRRLVGIEVMPSSRQVRPHSIQQLRVTAIYSDQSRRDVTDAASYTTNALSIAQVNPTGLAEIGEIPGEAAITINYMGQITAARLLVPHGGSTPIERPAHYSTTNPIDELVWARLEKLRIIPSGSIDDAGFLRRVFLTMIGTLPTPGEVTRFLADDDKNKRARLVDQVLVRNEYADFWAQRWSDILMANPEKLGNRGAYELHRWLRLQMAMNRPSDEWVYELLTATGNSGSHGPVNFFRGQRTPEELTRTVSQALLGIRMDCAQCHHHPFEIWGQADFYGLAGYFTGLQRTSLGESREFIFHAGHKPTKIPVKEIPVVTRPPGGPDLPLDQQADPRVHLAEWITSKDNPFFARLLANRIWKQLMGRALVEPEDDLRTTNPASNPPLLDYLAAELVHNDFNVRALARTILLSGVFQTSSTTNASNFSDTQNFSHYPVRRIQAEVLLDAISQVTMVPEHFSGHPLGTRAIELWDNKLPSYFLDVFGRSERKSPCECGSSGEPTMTQALHLLNAPEIEAKIQHKNGRIAQLVASGMGLNELVSELTHATLSRPPTDAEKAVAKKLFSEEPPELAAQDFLWTLLNSYDFLFIK